MRQTATLAMVGLGQVDQLEVEREGARKLVSTGGVFGLLVDASEHRGEISGGLRRSIFQILATLAGCLAQSFDRFIHTGRGLLPQHDSEQHAQRADVAAQRRSFKVARRRSKFGEALRPGGRKPEGRHI